VLAIRPLLWTADDIALLDDWPDGFRYEASDGILEVSPPPDLGHEEIPEQLQRQLQRQLPPGWQVSLVRAVKTPSGWRLPDLFVRAVPSRQPQTARYYPADEVALAVEVESPTGLDRDRVVKHREYAEAGIAAYWRIERTPALTVVAYVLVDTTYEQVARLTSGTAVLPGPVPLTVDVDALSAR